MNRYINLVLFVMLCFCSKVFTMEKPGEPKIQQLSQRLISLIASPTLNPEEIKKVIRLGADPNIVFETLVPGLLSFKQEQKTFNPLLYALYYNKEDLLELLLNCKANPYCFISDVLSESPAERILSNKRLYEKFLDKILEEYPKKHPISPITEHTILIQPIMTGNPQILEKILNNMSPQQIKEAFLVKGFEGNTLLHEALDLYQKRTNPDSKTNLARIISILMRYNAPLDITNNQQETPREIINKLPDLKDFLEQKATPKPATLPAPIVQPPAQLPGAAAETL